MYVIQGNFYIGQSQSNPQSIKSGCSSHKDAVLYNFSEEAKWFTERIVATQLK